MALLNVCIVWPCRFCVLIVGWVAMHSGNIPLRHGTDACLSTAFLNLFAGGAGYETRKHLSYYVHVEQIN